jgi:hypothetical protein
MGEAQSVVSPSAMSNPAHLAQAQTVISVQQLQKAIQKLNDR